jgi:hypothetical protein
MKDVPTLDIDIAGPIIAKFGGRNAMHKDTGLPYSRIDGWARRKNIPENWRPTVLREASRLGVPHTPLDYIAHLMDLKYDIAA